MGVQLKPLLQIGRVAFLFAFGAGVNILGLVDCMTEAAEEHRGLRLAGQRRCDPNLQRRILTQRSLLQKRR